VITTTVKEALNEEVMDVDGLFCDVGRAVGKNVAKAIKRSLSIHMSSLTGAQAAKLLDVENYTEIVNITEGPCICDLRRAAAAHMTADERAYLVCRRCKVMRVWEVYAGELYPLLSCNATPPALAEAKRQGDLANYLMSVHVKSEEWLQLYVTTFGYAVTPYVHIVGKHLAELLAQEGHTVGGWSQQGFEAAHKLIRRIFHNASNQGGGRGNCVSALLQIVQHIFRSTWCRVRAAFQIPVTKRKMGGQPPSASCIALRTELRRQMHRVEWEDVDNLYAANHPENRTERYISQQCKRTLFQAAVATDL